MTQDEYGSLTMPQGTATGAQKRAVARFGGWRGVVLAACAVLACLWGVQGLMARVGVPADGSAQIVGDTDPDGMLLHESGWNMRNELRRTTYHETATPPPLTADGLSPAASSTPR